MNRHIITLRQHPPYYDPARRGMQAVTVPQDRVSCRCGWKRAVPWGTGGTQIAQHRTDVGLI